MPHPFAVAGPTRSRPPSRSFAPGFQPHRISAHTGGCWLVGLLALALPAALAPMPACANNYGESLAWQFKTSADRANQAALLDLIARKRGGYYAAPVYTTTIDRQYVCSIAPTATGNSDGQSAIANSPTVTGAASTAAGNSSATTVDSGRAGASVDGTQTNSGVVTAGVTGSTDTLVHGVAWQALNSTQSNSGSQSASVTGSSACAFGVLN